MLQTDALRWLRPALVILACFLGGCSLPIFTHIHNDGRATAAHDAQNAMTEYGKNSPAMYSAMTANIELFRADEEATISQFAANKSTALVTKLPSMSGKEFTDRVSSEKKEADNLEQTALSAVSKAQRDMNQEEIKSKSLKDAVQAEQSEVQTLKDQVTAWNGQVAFFQTVIQDLPEAKLNLSKADASKLLSDPSQITKLAQAAGSSEIKYSDADGKSKSSSVGEFVSSNFTTISDNAFKGNLSNALVDAPGVDLTLANLALDLSQLEQKRTEMRLAENRALLELLQKSWIQLEVARELLNSAGDFGNLGYDDGIMVYNDILSVAQDKTGKCGTQINCQNTVAKTLFCLREEAVAESIISRVEALTPLAVARMMHVNSISESEINDQEYQSLISSGLAGLVSYHDGGLTGQDVANVINFAQAVGVGVIAGKVY